jgi:hypothetical protein
VECPVLEPIPDPGSFRDPLSKVFIAGDRVLRGLTPAATRDFLTAWAAPFFREGLATGRLIGTERVDGGPAAVGLGEEWEAVVEHPKLPHWTYPYEWSFSMLKDAALLQLQLQRDALGADVSCKDATPYNIQFVGVRPTFIDVGSFERYQPGDPWFGYLQFCQLFLFPLMLQAYVDVGFHALLRGSLEGIEPEQMWHLLGVRHLAKRGVPIHVALHARLQRGLADSSTDMKAALKKSGYRRSMIEANVNGLHRLVSRLRWKRSESNWSNYSERGHYTSSDIATKEAFVRQSVAGRGHKLAWDVGCNDGRFSRLIADEVDHVLALDRDHLVVDVLYHALKAQGVTNITPLVFDLADPSPGLGWDNRERSPFLDRCRPDFIVALAVVHHLAIGANVPTAAFLELIRGLGCDTVVEFPTEHDPMVKRLLRNKREGVHDDYSLRTFEAQVESRFQVRRREVLETRVLFDLTPR